LADTDRALAEGRPQQADRQPQPADRRGQILDAALAIADEQGLDAVTMRAVAARIGVTAMALYPHVSSKDDLLDGLVDHLLAELSRPDPAQPWPDRLRALGRSAREVAHRHPAVAPLLFTRPAATPGAVMVVDIIYQALLDAGVPAGEVARVERLVSTFVLGYAISETGGRFGTGDPRERRALLEGTELPAHRALLARLETSISWDAEFETDLDDLIKLIENVAGLSLRFWFALLCERSSYAFTGSNSPRKSRPRPGHANISTLRDPRCRRLLPVLRDAVPRSVGRCPAGRACAASPIRLGGPSRRPLGSGPRRLSRELLRSGRARGDPSAAQ
jgi:AcrR family transcriptional regulator